LHSAFFIIILDFELGARGKRLEQRCFPQKAVWSRRIVFKKIQSFFRKILQNPLQNQEISCILLML